MVKADDVIDAELKVLAKNDLLVDAESSVELSLNVRFELMMQAGGDEEISFMQELLGTVAVSTCQFRNFSPLSATIEMKIKIES